MLGEGTVFFLLHAAKPESKTATDASEATPAVSPNLDDEADVAVRPPVPRVSVAAAPPADVPGLTGLSVRGGEVG